MDFTRKLCKMTETAEKFVISKCEKMLYFLEFACFLY